MRATFRSTTSLLCLLGTIALAASGCRPQAAIATASPVQATASPPTVAPTASGARATGAPAERVLPREAITILSPGPGSKVASPVQLSGEADPTFEQTLAVRVVSMDGTTMTSLSTTIRADAGQRGPFAVQIPVDVPQPQQAMLQVYAASPRDGGFTHLASVIVTLLPQGAPGEQIRPASAQPERIVIDQPGPGQSLTGGKVHIAGFALASFEQTLVVELYDGEGRRLASQPVIISAPDMGVPGPFQTDLAYPATASGPGRVVVRDISPANGADVHLASVEASLSP